MAKQKSLPPSPSDPLTSLCERFTDFHLKNPPRSRIPAELREAFLQALDAGLRSGQAAKACGVSPSQIQHWRRGQSSLVDQRSLAKTSQPRIFSIIDKPPQPQSTNKVEFQFRVAQWQVRVELKSGGLETP
jgi:transposase-like protein